MPQAAKIRSRTKPQAKKTRRKSNGLKIARKFTHEGIHPFDEVEWTRRRSAITDEKGNEIFAQDDVEVPTTWSQLATDILVSKYFRKAGPPTKEGREVSLKQVVTRIAKTIRKAGENFGGYFVSKKDAENFEAELTSLLVNQYAAFNSPVWFNCGLYHEYGIKGSGGNWHWDFKKNKVQKTTNAYKNPQCSACFIQSIQDDLMSIFNLVKSEARLFKYGSGTGTNFSNLRSKYEKLSGGGYSSGLMSFLEVFDRGAGATKSGGTTRRAAKMVCLDMDHPEIEKFINWKVREEDKAFTLIKGGYSSDFNSEAYRTVGGQNSNNSLRISDNFMNAYLTDEEWTTYHRTTNEPHKTYRAKDLMDQITYAAWRCADPGVQFDTTINEWHTSANTNRIYASNPCSEYMFLDDSACNLASLNIIKFTKKDGSINIPLFRHAARIIFIAQEILVDFSSYPTEEIAKNSHDYRPLGLGYANLGTHLMANGVPYDSEEGLAITGAITAIMCGEAYKTSAEMARFKKPFNGFAQNREPMLRVIRKHRFSVDKIKKAACPENLLRTAEYVWQKALELGEKHGYRNAQTTVIAPTGTIGLLMDCDTTGVEPDFALVKFKKLAGGGYFKIVNQSLHAALKKLGYDEEQSREIIDYVIGKASFAGAPHINYESLQNRGLTTEEIEKIEKNLKQVFEISQALSVWNVGEETLSRLGIKEKEWQKPGFNLLLRLGFTKEQVNEASDHICGRLTIEGAPYLQEKHYPVFDCATTCGRTGKRFIKPMAHVRIMAAVQPFISGAISKTVNVPNETTTEEIKDIYLESWRMGLKAIAIYRDGSKHSQPLSGGFKENEGKNDEDKDKPQPIRLRLPDERKSITHKFSVAQHEGYITVGLYEDNRPGEIFITMSKQGSVIAGLVDAFATSVSIALQYGVPLRILVNKFAHMRFEPAGFTTNPRVQIAKSIIDYIFRWLALKFLPKSDWESFGIAALPEDEEETTEKPIATEAPQETEKKEINAPAVLAISKNEPAKRPDPDLQGTVNTDSPACSECGGFMVRSGTCHKCLNCGSTSGCS